LVNFTVKPCSRVLVYGHMTFVVIYVFIYGVFYNALRSSDYIASNMWIISKQSFANDLGCTSPGLSDLDLNQLLEDRVYWHTHVNSVRMPSVK
jgi:hypothetical protein